MKKKKTILIISDKPGQLCNRLWAISPLIALALDQQLKIYIPFFKKEYADFFQNIEQFPNVRFEFSDLRLVNTLICKIVRVCNLFLKRMNKVIPLSLFNISFIEKELPETINNKTSIYFIRSWSVQNKGPYVLKQKDAITALFLPRNEIKTDVDNQIMRYKKKGLKIVGIHIRKGDYAAYRNGRYYFNDSTYTKYINEMNCLLKKKGYETAFLLCSNGDIYTNQYNEGNLVFIINKTNAIKDLYALSLCDYILGPPSTFSMWASFYGRVPLKFISSSEEEITLNSFSPIIYQNVFYNGNKFVH